MRAMRPRGWRKDMESADVVIGGGGIMGCALSYQLGKRGGDVPLLERETLGSQSTGKCAGGVRQQFSMEANVRLQRLAVKLLEGFEDEAGHPAALRQTVYPAEAARMVPVLNVDDVLGCTFCPSDGIASPADVTAGYAGAARRKGARLKEGG